IAQALGLASVDSAEKQLRRAEAGLFHAYVELLGQRPGRPAGCKGFTRLIGLQLRGELKDERAREELKAHLAGCAFCRQTEEEAALGRQLAGLLPMPPLDGILARKSHFLRLVRKQAPGASHVPHALALSHIALPLVAAVGAATIVTTAVVVRQQSGHPSAPPAAAVVATASPSQASGARLAAVPAATAKNPCVSSRLGGLAYVSQREVVYRSSPSANPVQVTHTGARVDTFAWQPDGKALAYLVGAEWSSDRTGTLYVISPAGSGTTKLADGVSAFAYAPDGSAIVLAFPAYDPKTKAQNGYRLEIRPLGTSSSVKQIGTPSEAAQGPTPDPRWKQLFEWFFGPQPPLPPAPPPSPIARVFPDTAIWWMEDGIYMTGNGVIAQIDPATGAVTPRSWIEWQDHVLYQAPPASLVVRQETAIVSTCPGKPATLLPFSYDKYARQLDVSADGASGLVTVQGFGPEDPPADVYLVTADGGVTALTSDGESSIALWQPVIARGERQ
ncbi:MAG TPA: hypothetical protein VF157_11810, partial [Chloroflexota bacterium]